MRKKMPFMDLILKTMKKKKNWTKGFGSKMRKKNRAFEFIGFRVFLNNLLIN